MRIKTRRTSLTYTVISGIVTVVLGVWSVLYELDVTDQRIPGRLYGLLLLIAGVFGVVGLLGISMARLVGQIYGLAYRHCAEDSLSLMDNPNSSRNDPDGLR